MKQATVPASVMPIEKGAPIYNATQAERAWGKLLALYKAALV